MRSLHIAYIAIFAALWAVLNRTVATLFFAVFHSPVMCDILAITCITIPIWLNKQFGTGIAVAIVAYILNMLLMPSIFLVAWIATGVILDVGTRAAGYHITFSKNWISYAILMPLFVIGAAVGGFLIGLTMFTELSGILMWTGYHALGGFIGGLFSIGIWKALEARGIGKFAVPAERPVSSSTVSQEVSTD
jgi:hypothetical protein